MGNGQGRPEGLGYGVTDSFDMSLQRNKDVVRAFVEAINDRDWAVSGARSRGRWGPMRRRAV